MTHTTPDSFYIFIVTFNFTVTHADLRSSLALTKLFHSSPNVMHKYFRLYRCTSYTQIECT